MKKYIWGVSIGGETLNYAVQGKTQLDSYDELFRYMGRFGAHSIAESAELLLVCDAADHPLIPRIDVELY